MLRVPDKIEEHSFHPLPASCVTYTWQGKVILAASVPFFCSEGRLRSSDASGLREQLSAAARSWEVISRCTIVIKAPAPYLVIIRPDYTSRSSAAPSPPSPLLSPQVKLSLAPPPCPYHVPALLPPTRSVFCIWLH